MSAGYRTVQWNRHKARYDLIVLAAVVGYVAAFVVAGGLRWGGGHAVDPPVVLMRATATAAFVLLHVILCTGPLCRLDRRFLPLLYNRRHLGVITFILAALHALVAVGFYHGFGALAPAVSLLTSNVQYRSVSAFPFEVLGLAALVVLFLMAATSHDFWLKNLSPRVWKGLHMLVYPAYVLLVLHVALGALQSERSAAYPALLGGGVLLVAGLHLAAGLRERRRDSAAAANAGGDGPWVDVGAAADVPEGRATVVSVAGGERVAIFRHRGRLSALSNVCAHQGGPLGEGKVIDGCVTCPWHGYQYRAETGQSPPPFDDKVRTYRLRLGAGGRLLLDPTPLPPGTPTDPVDLAPPTGPAAAPSSLAPEVSRA